MARGLVDCCDVCWHCINIVFCYCLVHSACVYILCSFSVDICFIWLFVVVMFYDVLLFSCVLVLVIRFIVFFCSLVTKPAVLWSSWHWQNVNHSCCGKGTFRVTAFIAFHFFQCLIIWYLYVPPSWILRKGRPVETNCYISF